MNLVIVTGNVCQVYDNGNNVRISIADNYKDTTTYIPIFLFSGNAEFAKKYIVKGDHVSIEGRIGNYKGNDGKEHLTIIANRINFEGYRNPNKGKTTVYNPNYGVNGQGSTTWIDELYEPAVLDIFSDNDNGESNNA